ncbi:caspase-1 [Amyelois transitella]|uniref:caspase-1 n=1 Tax=Amyelois transitella TaxID=680683 RepID=UPI00067BF723|nr:caspase-1 [Amyelois transitella]
MSQAEQQISNGCGVEQRPNGSYDDDNDNKDCPNSLAGSDHSRDAKMPVYRDPMYYKMDHKHRGIAIIFNHEYFDVHDLKPRRGTQVDGDNLSRVLESLGFCVTIYNNLDYHDLIARVQQVAQMDHSHADCLLMAVLTHGELGILYANDTHYKAENLWINFTADRCPTLVGKPKLFFIQACQGNKFDGGITVSNVTETDGSSGTYRYPIHADFLIAFSTIPGYYSWRDCVRGSWFMQALCEELRCFGTERDILTLLTLVTQRVALDFESSNPDLPAKHQQKQVPCITSMLTRVLVFGKKN